MSAIGTEGIQTKREYRCEADKHQMQKGLAQAAPIALHTLSLLHMLVPVLVKSMRQGKVETDSEQAVQEDHAGSQHACVTCKQHRFW